MASQKCSKTVKAFCHSKRSSFVFIVEKTQTSRTSEIPDHKIWDLNPNLRSDILCCWGFSELIRKWQDECIYPKELRKKLKSENIYTIARIFFYFLNFFVGLHSNFYFLIGQTLFPTTKILKIWLLVYGMVIQHKIMNDFCFLCKTARKPKVILITSGWHNYYIEFCSTETISCCCITIRHSFFCSTFLTCSQIFSSLCSSFL